MKSEYVKPTLTRLNNSEHEYEYITLTYFTIIIVKNWYANRLFNKAHQHSCQPTERMYE